MPGDGLIHLIVQLLCGYILGSYILGSYILCGYIGSLPGACRNAECKHCGQCAPDDCTRHQQHLRTQSDCILPELFRPIWLNLHEGTKCATGFGMGIGTCEEI